MDEFTGSTSGKGINYDMRMCNRYMIINYLKRTSSKLIDHVASLKNPIPKAPT